MADAIGQTLYVGNVNLKAQAPRVRAPRVPDGMTRAEIAEVLASTIAHSAEFMGALGCDPEIVTSPAHVASIARNLRTLANILDSGADALSRADE